MSYATFADWKDFISRLAGSRGGSWSGLYLWETRRKDDDGRSMGIWDEEPDDILKVLLFHCDHDGIIEARHVGPLADRLEGLIDPYEERLRWKVKVAQEKADLFYRLLANKKIKEIIEQENIFTTDELKQYEKRLALSLVKKIQESDESNYIAITRQFIRGLRAAHEAGDKVEFR